MRWMSFVLASFLLTCVALGQAAAAQQNPLEWTRLFASPPMATPNRIRTMTGAPGPDYWQQQADYSIHATLDAETSVVTCDLTLDYTNNSPEDLPYLWFHLEQNIFRKDSLARRVAAVGGAAGERIESVTDGVVLKSVRCRGRDLAHRVHDTLLRVDLPQPVRAGGGCVRLTIEWSMTVPEDNSLRMGRAVTPDGTIFALAQWFPAVVKFDDISGWNTLPYLGPGEFYTEYGDYEVELTVPHSHLVAASGTLRNPRQVLTSQQRERLDAARASRDTLIVRDAAEVGSGRPEGEGPLTWRFTAERVRTFAWCSSASFVWDACSTDKGVLCQSFYPRSALPLWSEGTQDLRQSIEHYGRMWFDYPYPQASNVNAYGSGGGGMEYPMIIFNGRCDSSYDLFALVAHEIGHNWFPMVVNTDERRHAWMDEGFNTFVNYYAIFEKFGKGGSWFDRDGWESGWRGIAAPMSTAPDRMPPGSLGFLGYDKPAWMMRTLREQVLGAERFDAAFREYIRRWAFRSPTPADFMRTMENAAGMDLAWFWNSWIYSGGRPDVQFATERPRGRRATGAGGAATGNAGDAAGAGADARAEPTDLRVTHGGLFVHPVPWKVTMNDGTVQQGVIPAEAFAFSRTVAIPISGKPADVREATLDPDQLWPDLNRANNVRR